MSPGINSGDPGLLLAEEILMGKHEYKVFGQT
jgi:hypothetical protein